MAGAGNVPLGEDGLTGPGQSSGAEPSVDDRAADGRDPLDVVERATAVLMRNFELLRRRSGMYAELDKAGYLLLRTLEEVGPTDIRGVAAAVGLDPSTAGRQVAVMQDKGLVTRAPDPADRRRSIISPTDEGQRRMVLTRSRRREATAELLAEWSEEELSVLGSMLNRYNASVARQYLSGPPGD